MSVTLAKFTPAHRAESFHADSVSVDVLLGYSLRDRYARPFGVTFTPHAFEPCAWSCTNVHTEAACPVAASFDAYVESLASYPVDDDDTDGIPYLL